MIPTYWPYSPETYQAFVALKEAGFTPHGHCQLVELRAVDGHVEPGLGSRVDLRSGAQAAAVAMPVTSFQVANRVPISRRYSSAVSR